MPLALPKSRSELQYFDQVIDGDDMVIVHDPVRGTYSRYNPLQAAMLRLLDGTRSVEQMVVELGQKFDVEVPTAAGERFIAHARKMMLLDITSYGVSEGAAQKQVYKALSRSGFTFRSASRELEDSSVQTAEASLFLAGIRQLQAGHPAKALDYFSAVLELNANNQRARTLYEIIHTAYVKALSARTTDFPVILTFDPTRILRVLERTVGRIVFSSAAPYLLILLLIATAYSYSVTSYQPIDIGNADIPLLVVFSIALGYVHEFGHALTCYHFGGKVPEIGFMLFFVIHPVPYCDTSSSYLFTNRMHKVYVQLAGMITSLVCVCLLTILLSLLQTDLFIFQSLQLTLYIAALFVFFDLIPFMKLDGYYALCDFFSVPNLRARSLALVRAYASTRLLGIPEPTEPLEPRTRRRFVIFGLLSIAFTITWIYYAFFNLLAPVVETFGVTGLILSLLLLAYLLRKSLFHPVGRLIQLIARERRRVFSVRRVAVMTGVTLAVVAPLLLIEVAVTVDSDFVLVPAHRVEVRAQTSGVIERILVREGERVSRDQPIAVLRNDDLELKIRVTEADLEWIDAQIAQLENGARAEEIALARSQLGAAAATQHQASVQAQRQARLARAQVGTASRADSSAASAAEMGAKASVARLHLEVLEAGSREEDVAAAKAKRMQTLAQLDQLRADQRLLTLRSPIDGIIATKHLEYQTFSQLLPGATFAEVYNNHAFTAEISMSPSTPMAEIGIGDHVALRMTGSPDDDIEARIERVRSTDDSGQLVVVTSPFTVERGKAGMSGHARLYGRQRSLAYSKLYLPLQRVVRVTLWAL